MSNSVQTTSVSAKIPSRTLATLHFDVLNVILTTAVKSIPSSRRDFHANTFKCFTPFRLSHVCQSFRHTMRTSTQNWTFLHVDAFSQRAFPLDLEYASTICKRSKQMPLHLVVDGTDRLFRAQHLRFLLELLESVVTRLSIVWLFGVSDCIIEVDEMFLTPRAPRLEQLLVESKSVDDDNGEEIIALFSHDDVEWAVSPQTMLNNISIAGLPIWCLSPTIYPAVRRLAICDTIDFLFPMAEIPSHFPALDNLAISLYYGCLFDFRGVSSARPLVLSITCLELINRAYYYLAAFNTLVHFPHLRILKITSGTSKLRGWAVLTNRYASQLTEIHLEAFVFTRRMIESLGQLVALKLLYVRDFPNYRPLFEALTEHYPTKAWYMPCLVKLDICGIVVDLDTSRALFALLFIRVGGWESRLVHVYLDGSSPCIDDLDEITS